MTTILSPVTLLSPIMENSILLGDAQKVLDLANIRFQLIRLEDTIIFHLIERAQFPLNRSIYVPGAVTIPNSKLSFLDWYLREQEKLQSLIRRYQAPDEFPYFPDAQQTPILPPLPYPRILHPNNVNVNETLKSVYINKVLPAACANQDRGEALENYGSAATCDIACLQALSRRIHFGKIIAESKFQSERERFTQLILAEDRDGIADAITNSKVEQMILKRLELKANTYGTDPSETTSGGKIDAEAVVTMYKDFVIPLTKDVEVEYLMQRLQPPHP